MFQLYAHGDHGWMGELLGRVEASGYKAVALTVDGGQVYFATNDGAAIGNSTILSMPIAGGNSTVLATGQTNTAEIVVQGGYVYWSNRGNGGVPNGPTGSTGACGSSASRKPSTRCPASSRGRSRASPIASR